MRKKLILVKVLCAFSAFMSVDYCMCSKKLAIVELQNIPTDKLIGVVEAGLSGEKLNAACQAGSIGVRQI